MSGRKVWTAWVYEARQEGNTDMAVSQKPEVNNMDEKMTRRRKIKLTTNTMCVEERSPKRA